MQILACLADPLLRDVSAAEPLGEGVRKPVVCLQPLLGASFASDRLLPPCRPDKPLSAYCALPERLTPLYTRLFQGFQQDQTGQEREKEKKQAETIYRHI